MVFTELTEEQRRQALEGQVDVLTPMVQSDAKLYADSYCPRCGGHGRKELDMHRALKEARIIPRYNMRCLECEALYDPWSGLILEMGNLANIDPGLPLIR